MELIKVWHIYLFGIIPNISYLLSWFLAISCLLSIVAIVFIIVSYAVEFDSDTSDSDQERIKIYRKKLRIIFYMLFIFGTARAVMPDQKTIAAMYIIPPIINNLQVQQAVIDGGKEIATAGKAAMLSALNVPPTIEKFISDYLKLQEEKDNKSK